MQNYPFDLIRPQQPEPLADKTLLARRPFAEVDRSFQTDATRFVPGEQLTTAINTAIAVGEPLLITGEPGTGKTQAAYYAAYKLGIEPLIHFQVKSDSTARDLLYYFDTVRYFHDAHLLQLGQPTDSMAKTLNKSDYVEPRALWLAFQSASETGHPQVLLIDEIDKAPRDFPNDLLHELDKMEFSLGFSAHKKRLWPLRHNDQRPNRSTPNHGRGYTLCYQIYRQLRIGHSSYPPTNLWVSTSDPRTP